MFRLNRGFALLNYDFPAYMQKRRYPAAGDNALCGQADKLLLKRNCEYLSGMDQIRIVQNIAIGIENLHVFSGLLVKMLRDFSERIAFFNRIFCVIIVRFHINIGLDIARFFAANGFNGVPQLIFFILAVDGTAYFEYAIFFFDISIFRSDFFTKVEYGLILCFY